MIVAISALVAAQELVRFHGKVVFEIQSADRRKVYLRIKGQKRVLDLHAYHLDRMAHFVPGSKDKSANTIVWRTKHGMGVNAYLLQALPIEDHRAIGIIGFSANGYYTPSDIVHDLVSIDYRAKPKITFLRSLPVTADREMSPAPNRLFWSKSELLLRQPGGFDVIDGQGRKKLSFEFKDAGNVLGLNPSGQLVIRGTQSMPGIGLYNLSARTFKWLPWGLDKVGIESFYEVMDSPKEVLVEYTLRRVGRGKSSSPEWLGTVQARLDSETGSVIGKPSYRKF